MIVVANPSKSAGSSFKGLHQYCAHDVDKAITSERVEWMDTRNIAADPQHAYKVMIATAANANELKKQAGVKAGRKSTTGEVLHLVLSFDKDEPSDRATVNKAVDGMLANLGADPAKMRGKSKPARRQFADEHQAVLYVHKDTDNTHVHVMVNTVHPETGIRLPTSNNYNKLQKWADGFAQEYGTAHKTPARQENREMREAGEYVKHPDRPNRKAFEEAQELKAASNDNDRVKAFVDAQKTKDAALFAKGREMVKDHSQRLEALKNQLVEKKALADKAMQIKINKAKAQIREEYRPKMRMLKDRQSREMDTFNALETTFWGRAKNTAKAIKDAYHEQGGAISRSFRILSNSGERKAYMERAQMRERKALENEQIAKVDAKAHDAKKSQTDDYNAARAEFLKSYADEKKRHVKDDSNLKALWRSRIDERKADLEKFKALEPKRTQAKSGFGRSVFSDAYLDRINRAADLRHEFEQSKQTFDKSQDNEEDHDDGQER